jgi:hypothetical protein
MDFIYLHEKGRRNLLQYFKLGGEGLRGRDSGDDLTNVPYKPI